MLSSMGSARTRESCFQVLHLTRLQLELTGLYICSFQTDLASIRAKGTIVWLGFASGPVEPFAPHIMALKAVKYVFAS